ncbi:MAG: hypothetical protein ACXVAD_09870 [Syntrophales bacterium]
MNWVEDIINEHEKREAEEIRSREEADEIKKREKEDLNKEWEKFVEDIIHPVLAQVAAVLKEKSYECIVQKVPYTDGRTGITGTKEIKLTTNIEKRAPSFSPNKASITFSSDAGSISIQLEPVKLFRVSTQAKMSLSDNQDAVVMIMTDFLNKVYPK